MPRQREWNEDGPLGEGSPDPTPYDYAEAKRAVHLVITQRRNAELALREQVRKAAEAEVTYRKALAKAMLEAEGPDAKAREAVARAACAEEAMDRDIQAGLVRVAQERLQGLQQEIALCNRMVEWSMRADPDVAAMWQVSR